MGNETKGKWTAFVSDHFVQVHIAGKSITLEWSEENIANAHLIVAAVNACIKVNRDNPMAVAESIGEMYEACELGRQLAEELLRITGLSTIYHLDVKKTKEQIEQALALADRKEV